MSQELFKSNLSGTVEPTEETLQPSAEIRRNANGSIIVPIICNSKEKADKSLEDNPTLSYDVGETRNDKVCTDNGQPNPKDSEITSSLPAADPPTVNTMPCESRNKGKPPLFGKGSEVKDNNIYRNGEQLTKGLISVIDKRVYLINGNPERFYARIAFENDEFYEQVEIPISALTNAKLSEFIPEWFEVIGLNDKDNIKFLCKALLKTVSTFKTEKYMYLSFGYNYICDKYVYNTGNRLINGSQIESWKSDSDVRMKYAKPQPHNVYKDLMFRLSQTNNYPAVLLIATLIPYVLPLVDKDKRDRYDFSLYIEGKSSSGKTEIAKLFSTPFEGNEHMVSLSSDIEAIHKLSAYKDCTVVIDDLNASDSDEIRRNKEKKLSAIIETKQSVGRAIVDGKNTKISAMPIITAEYFLKAVGALNRCMIVHIKRPFKPSELTWLQENHDTYIAFINSFIEYICMNFDKLQTDVNEYLSTRKYRMKNGKDIPGWQRISNIQFILEATLMVVMKFFGDKDDTPDCFPSFWDPFKQSIQECKEYIADLIRKRLMDKDELLMYELLSAIWNPKSGIVTDNKSSFLRDLGNHEKSLPERFVYYHEDKEWFCLRSEDAVRFLGGKIYNRNILQKLDDMGLIHTRKLDRTIEIFKKEKTNPLKNVRFICLKQKAVANYLGVENEYLPPDIKDKPYNGYLVQSATTNSGNYSTQTMSEQDETDYSDIEVQMCDDSDDMSDNPILSFINECGAKKHHKKF